MKNFIKMVLKYYYTVIVMALFILIMGIVTIAKTPIDIFPEINTPVVLLYGLIQVCRLRILKEG